MVHDEKCEMKGYRTTCHCAQRAYAKDPFPDTPNPYQRLEDDYNDFDEWMRR